MTVSYHFSDFLAKIFFTLYPNVHLWRGHGYYLGIKDENNSALDDLEDAKALMEVIMEKILVPCMVHLNKESLYLAKTACVKGREWTERIL